MLATKIQEKKNEEGFTLIELLVVVIIIGILAAIAIPAFLNQRESAWQGSVESDIRNAAIEIETAATRSRGEYPATGNADTETDVQTSSGVELTYVLDPEGTGANEYTICGTHEELGASESITYDSSIGGLADVAWVDDSACGTANLG